MKKRKTTTISCDEEARQFVAKEAERLHKTQRQVVDTILKEYQRVTKTQDERQMTALELFKELKVKMDTTCTSNATVVSTLRKMEESISHVSTNQSLIIDLISKMINGINSLNDLDYDTENFGQN